MTGFLTGWKTYLGGITIIVAALSCVLNQLSSGDVTHLTDCIARAGEGLAAVGLGHKLQRLLTVQNAK